MLCVQSKMSSICDLEQYLKEVFDKEHLPSERFGDVLITLTEAVNNAIIHGNSLNEDKTVWVYYQIVKDKLYFFVKDEGKGFDPNSIPDPTCLDRIEECGGRGVKIMSALSDYVSYKKNGSLVKLGFNL
jgi:serine/threonine-protein kinase RsbW